MQIGVRIPAEGLKLHFANFAKSALGNYRITLHKVACNYIQKFI